MADNALKAPLSTTIGRHVERRANDFIHPQSKGLPCRVVKVEKDILTIAFEGDNKVWNMPTRKIPQAISPYGRDPTQVGDKGYASPSDYHLGGISGLGKVKSSWQPRGNLTPLVFHPLSKENSESRNYNQLAHSGGPDGVKIIQTARQPKDEEAQPPVTPKMMQQMIGWGASARRAWLKRPAPPPMVTPLAEEDRSSMELDKDGKVVHRSKTGKHEMQIDEGGQKMFLKVPASGSKIWIGGTGKNPALYTPMGVNVMVKTVPEDD